MKISGIDTNLLLALQALLQEGSVTRAAKRLGVGQPAMSRSLARLRLHFKDPLLVIEEDYSDAFVGQKVMPWRIEDVLRARGANYVQGGLFKPFVVRDGRLITGQQQYTGRKVAEKVMEAMGV